MTDRDLINQTIDLMDSLKGREKIALSGKIHYPVELFRIDEEYLAKLTGRRPRLKVPVSRLLGRAERLMEQCERDRIGVVTWGDTDYPANLAQTADPPFRLYYRGQPPRRDWEGIAVVGTRLPTCQGKTEAFRMGLELASLECPLISGLALGIDGEAHKGSLVGGGITIAVLGSGVDLITPKRNCPIGRDILRNGGTILSEYPPGTPGAPWRFPARNRIVAGLSQAVVVVQAPVKSGALITADFALEEGREVAVMPSGVWAEGTAALIQSGAPLVDSALDVLRELNIDTRGWQSPALPDPVSREDLTAYMADELNGEVISHGGHYYRVS
ncbi:MAG: DNA-processing protein DprA [Spirochaetales bacterium]|nr:DNA-processing protein DprA [Spirochaetales bacterium]